jgi:hypothetical protein
MLLPIKSKTPESIAIRGFHHCVCGLHRQNLEPGTKRH